MEARGSACHRLLGLLTGSDVDRAGSLTGWGQHPGRVVDRVGQHPGRVVDRVGSTFGSGSWPGRVKNRVGLNRVRDDVSIHVIMTSASTSASGN